MPKSWFEIKAAAGNSADIYIYDEIGYWGITAVDFADQLRELGAVSTINLHINSPGGSVFDGIAIYNLLKNHKATITAYIDGLAASMGSVIPMAADRIVMPENAIMMIHNPWGGASGDAEEMRKTADILDKIKSSLMSVYIARTGKTEDEISDIMNAETWYTGAEAVAAGFADELAPSLDIAASFDLERYGFSNTPKTLIKPAAVAATNPPQNTEENVMPKTIETPTAATDALAAEKQRRTEVRAAFDGFTDHRDLMDTCLDDMECTVADAQAKLLAALGKKETPTATPHVEMYTDEKVAAKYRNDVTDALAFRAGLIATPQNNAMMGYTLYELARNALQRAGANIIGLDKMGIVAAAFTHTSADFGELLKAVANKSMLKGFDEAEETFQLWTAKGTLSDFKIASRVDLGTFPNLEMVPEGGEPSISSNAQR